MNCELCLMIMTYDYDLWFSVGMLPSCCSSLAAISLPKPDILSIIGRSSSLIIDPSRLWYFCGKNKHDSCRQMACCLNWEDLDQTNIDVLLVRRCICSLFNLFFRDHSGTPKDHVGGNLGTRRMILQAFYPQVTFHEIQQTRQTILLECLRWWFSMKLCAFDVQSLPGQLPAIG